MHDHEWREVRTLRLRALRDEAARIAFVDKFEDASGRPDEFWQERVALASVEAGSDAGARQFVAVTEQPELHHVVVSSGILRGFFAFVVGFLCSVEHQGAEFVAPVTFSIKQFCGSEPAEHDADPSFRAAEADDSGACPRTGGYDAGSAATGHPDDAGTDCRRPSARTAARHPCAQDC